ncbi:hypothetical protein OSTOST_12370, partial [Ostertagia ostertagi]
RDVAGRWRRRARRVRGPVEPPERRLRRCGAPVHRRQPARGLPGALDAGPRRTRQRPAHVVAGAHLPPVRQPAPPVERLLPAVRRAAVPRARRAAAAARPLRAERAGRHAADRHVRVDRLHAAAQRGRHSRHLAAAVP